MDETIKNEFETYWESLNDDARDALNKMSVMWGWIEGRQTGINNVMAKLHAYGEDMRLINEMNNEKIKPNGVLKQAAPKYVEAFYNKKNKVIKSYYSY